MLFLYYERNEVPSEFGKNNPYFILEKNNFNCCFADILLLSLERLNLILKIIIHEFKYYVLDQFIIISSSVVKILELFYINY